MNAVVIGLLGLVPVSLGLAWLAFDALAVVEGEKDDLLRELQDLEYDRLIRSREVHETVGQARRAMVEEVRRANREDWR